MYIYKITNTVNNKVYIGRTIRSVEQRFQEHLAAAEKGCKQHLYQAMRLYGTDVFVVEQIDTADSIEELSQKEAYWTAYYDAYHTGYNMTSAGESNPMECEKSRRVHDLQMRTPEVRAKISESMKSYKKTHPVSAETRQKLSRAAQGNQKGKGKKRSPAAIEATARGTRKKVYCVDQSGQKVASFNSVKEAAMWWYDNGCSDRKGYRTLMTAIKLNASCGRYSSRGLKWFYE